jgi:preprotein translocase subunit SecG
VHIFIAIIHVIACIVLILVVLLQAGKGASMGAAFGGSSQTVFGSSGPGTFLGKVTSAIAIIFMVTSLILSYLAVHKGSSLLNATPQRTERKIPLAPAKPSAPALPTGAGQSSAPAAPAPSVPPPAK